MSTMNGRCGTIISFGKNTLELEIETVEFDTGATCVEDLFWDYELRYRGETITCEELAEEAVNVLAGDILANPSAAIEAQVPSDVSIDRWLALLPEE